MRSRDTEVGSSTATDDAKNPKRVAAGKLNRESWPGLTPEGRERLRLVAKANQPWRFATGPRTAAGKAKAAANGRKRQKGLFSVRQLRAEVANYRQLERELQHAETS